MKNKANKLAGTFQKVARAMSRNWDVTVVPSGLDCSTNGTTINYPFNADFLDGASQKVLHGLLDHEVAHVAEEREHAKSHQKTPLKLMKSLKSNKERMLLNVFEDIRIETKYSKKYIGMAENLNEANLNSVDMFQKRHGLKGESKEAKVNFWHTLGSGIIMKARGYDIDWMPKSFAPYMKALEDEIAESTTTNWAKDSLGLAKRVIAKVDDVAERLEEEKQKREEKKQDKESKEQDKEQEGEGSGKGSSDEDPEGEDSQSGSSSDEEGEESSQGQDSESDENDRGDKNITGPKQRGSDDEQESSASTSESEAPTDEDKQSQDSDFDDMSDEEVDQAASRGESAMLDDADTDDLVKDVKEQIMDMAKDDAMSHGRYIPSPDVLKLDRWEKPDLGGVHAAAEYNKTKEVVAGQIRGLKGKLLNVIRSKAVAYMESGHRKGKLDKSRLAQVPAGNCNVFQVEREGETLDAAVSVLIDLSGSMGSGTSPHHKAYYAKMMAIALGETFSALNIPFEIIGFSNDWDVSAHCPAGTVRDEPIVYKVFKDFGDNFKRVRTRLNSITGKGNNTDGEALLAVATRLAQRQESRKIQFVLSDGMPAGGGVGRQMLCEHLKEVIELVTKAGIEVVGIGAQTDHIKDFYSKEHGASGIVIDDMDKLAVEVYKLMRAMLLNKKRRAA